MREKGRKKKREGEITTFCFILNSSLNGGGEKESGFSNRYKRIKVSLLLDRDRHRETERESD